MRSDSSEPSEPVITPIDFARPASLDDGQINSVRKMHEGFAYLTKQRIQSLYCIDQVECRLTNVEQILFREYRAGRQEPGIFSFIQMNPIPAGAVFELEPSLAFIFLDLDLGGTGDVEIPKRELSDFEMPLLERLVLYLLGNLREVWSSVIDLRPRLGNLGTELDWIPIAPDDDMTTVASFELRINDLRGTMSFAYPYACFQDLELSPREHYYNRPTDHESFGGDIARGASVRTFREFRVARNTTYAAVKKLQPGQTVSIDTDNASRTLYTARLESYDALSEHHSAEDLS